MPDAENPILLTNLSIDLIKITAMPEITQNKAQKIYSLVLTNPFLRSTDWRKRKKIIINIAKSCCHILFDQFFNNKIFNNS